MNIVCLSVKVEKSRRDVAEADEAPEFLYRQSRCE